MGTIDISKVKMNPVRQGETDLEAEVSTPYGTARLVLDFSRADRVGVRVTLPSGSTYTSAIDSWADDRLDHESKEGRDSTLRLAAAAVLQAFERERAKWS